MIDTIMYRLAATPNKGVTHLKPTVIQKHRMYNTIQSKSEYKIFLVGRFYFINMACDASAWVNCSP